MASGNEEELEKLKKIRMYLNGTENPDPKIVAGIYKVINGSDGFSQPTSANSQSLNSSSNSASRGGNSLGGKQLTKAIPGIPKMFSWDENNQGFSNYLMLAILAFSIQLIITLICIFFYK